MMALLLITDQQMPAQGLKSQSCFMQINEKFVKFDKAAVVFSFRGIVNE